MSARRSSQPSVQLFPFLAVLMCALGALILILLVTTTRIRDLARSRATQSHVSPTVAIPVPIPVASPTVPPRGAWKPLTLPPAVALHPVPATPEPDPSPPTESLREQWLLTVVDLEATAAAEETALHARLAVAESEEAALHETAAQLAGLQNEVESFARRRADVAAELQKSRQRAAELQRVIADQQSELQNLEQQQASAASRFSILPYDGRTGTVRRPIYIECTETGLTFASERITLTPEQLNGFPALQNPLRAGADALIDYWTLKVLKDAARDDAGAPYVLLIVRPRGTVGYYVARRMLESLEQSFGYELVPEELEIQWPQTDDGAVKALQAAIDAVLQNRDRFAFPGNEALPGSLTPLSVTDGQGRFVLEEVEKLRGNGRTVHFGGQTFDRDSSGAAPLAGLRGERTADARSRSDAGQSIGESSQTRTGRIAQGDALTDPGMGSANAAESPLTTARRAAAEAAEAFTSAAAQARKNSETPAEFPDGPPGPADNTPRPLPSLDAIDRDNLAPNRSPPRNPSEVLRDPGSQIGMERKVIIRVESQRVVVESEPSIDVSPGMSREELQSELAETLRTHFAGWGRPPRGFYWRPQVKFSVLPGGHQHVKRLSDLTDEWEIKSEIDFALE